MKLKSTNTYWPIKNGLTQSYPSLQTDAETDILIIGGGITGALIAYQLMNEGRKAMLVDKRHVCNGSTAATTALLQYEIDVSLHELIKIRGLKCAADSYKCCEKAIFDLKKIVDDIKSDCQFGFRKSVYFSSFKKDIGFLEKEYKARKELGLNVKWLDETDLKKLGINAFAAIESATGAVMDPYCLAQDLLIFSKKKGLKVYDQTEVMKIEPAGKKLLATIANKCTITARHIIHCSGYESTETLDEKIVDLKSTYALASESLEKLPSVFRDRIFWNTSDPYLYFRGTPDGRIIMGGGDEEFKDPEKRDALLQQKEKYLQKQFQKTFPGIDFITDYSWAGTFGETKDGLPYFGKPNPEINQHYILGFGGNGIVFSVMGMEAIGTSLDKKQHRYLEYYNFKR